MRRRRNRAPFAPIVCWRLALLTTVMLWVLHAAPALAQDQSVNTDLMAAKSNAPAMHVGPEIVISALDNEQDLPAAAFNSKHNEYLVVWHNKWSGGNRDIYAQRVTASGQLKSWFAVSAGPNSRAQPAVAYDPVHDRYLVVWAYDVNGNGTNWDIYGRFIPWDGPDNAMGEFAICDWTSTQTQPDIVYGAAQKEFLVVWTNIPPVVPSYVSARRVYAGGGFPNTKGFTVASHTTQQRLRPDVTYNLARNEYFVAFDNDLDIYGARVSGNGALLAGGEFKIAGWPDQEYMPAVAACADLDQFLVVWQSRTAASVHEIYGYLLAGDGTTQKVFLVYGSPLEETHPEIVCDATGRNYAVVWQQEVGLGGVTQGWALRRVHPDGATEPSMGFIGDADLSAPVLASGAVNSLAVWQQIRAGTAMQDIHASLIGMERLLLPELRK